MAILNSSEGNITQTILTYDVIILGAGAAGLMCAIAAGGRGRKVCVLEHNRQAGSKILVSGGGRCNFTNLHATPESFVSQNPDFCKSALSRFTPQDIIRLTERHRISYHEKKLGQLFCDRSAHDLLDMLLAECEQAGVLLRMETEVIQVKKAESSFFIQTNRGDYCATSLVVATGGLSMPKIGASDLGYRIARQFGLKIIPVAPALDGFVLDGKMKSDLEGLAGNSIDSLVTCGNVSFRENILITHFGLSGPAVLQASLYWRPGMKVALNLVPDVNMQEWLLEKKRSGSRSEVKSLLCEFFPKNFSERWCALHLKRKGPLSQIPDRDLQEFGRFLNHWEIRPVGTVGYHKAEVTRGGVSTEGLSSRTMEAKKVPGLYFIGEVVDVTGWLGGYNFQWAWASGWAAGQYV